MKKLICILLILISVLSLCGCGSSEYGVNIIETLESQDYYLAFRNDDNVYYYVTGAIQVLAAQGKVGELSAKWLGSNSAVDFKADASALDNLPTPEPRTLLIGVDIDSFPFVYIDSATGSYWGFDIQLSQAVCDMLGWDLQALTIKKENVYNELASGNIDVAWGGIALYDKEIDEGTYTIFGPYIHNDIVVASRAGNVMGSLSGKTMTMPSTTEAMEALQSQKKLVNKLGNVVRLQGGTTECFTYLYSNKCDVVLTDSTAIMYYNCH